MAFSLDDFLNNDFNKKKPEDSPQDAKVPESSEDNVSTEEIPTTEPVQLSGEFSTYDILNENEWHEDASEYDMNLSEHDYAPEYPAEESKPVDDDAIEELRRKLTEPVKPTPTPFDDIVAGLEFTEPEVIVVEKEVAKKNLTPLEEAAQKLAELEEQETITKSDLVAKQRAFKELEQQMNVLREELWEAQNAVDDVHYKKRDAKRRLEEEEVIEREKKIAEEAESRRNTAMAGFKNIIDELNPEWRHYAFDHQWEGASTMALHDSALLADDMGLGKTLEAIMHADMVQAKRVLLIAPNDTVSNFTMEWAIWAPHRFTWTLAGANKIMRTAIIDIYKDRLKNDQDFVLTINYEQLYTDIEFFAELMMLDFDTIYVDEFHNAKNKGGALFKKLSELRPMVKRVVPISGTFILNAPQDIWTALNLLDPMSFPDQYEFLNAYCQRDVWTGKWKFRSGGEQSMLRRLGGRIVKRTMEEAGIELPTQHIHVEDLHFDQYSYLDQQRIMKELALHSQIILDAERKTSIVEQIALITRQRQCAVFPAGIEIKDPESKEVLFRVGDEVKESIKMDWVHNKVKDLRGQGKRIAVFSQFKTALAELEERLKADGFRVVRYDGDTDKATKMKVKRDFDRKHVERTGGEFEWDIVLCNFKTGGVGLNFTHITDMVMLDEEWNPSKNEQAYKRIKRIGQTEETHIWIPRLRGSIDTWMETLNDQKREMIAGFNSEVDLQKELWTFLNIMKANDMGDGED